MCCIYVYSWNHEMNNPIHGHQSMIVNHLNMIDHINYAWEKPEKLSNLIKSNVIIRWGTNRVKYLGILVLSQGEYLSISWLLIILI